MTQKSEKQNPSEKQIKSLIKLIKEKIKQYNLSPENIKGHKEFPNIKKNCPGKLFDLEKIRKIIENNKNYLNSNE